MKATIIYPKLGNNENVEIKGERYRAELWQSHKGNYYEFIAVGENGKRNFIKTLNEVSQGIIDKVIKRL